MTEKKNQLSVLANKLKTAFDLHEKLEVLQGQEEVIQFLKEKGLIQTYLHNLNEECTLVLLSIVAIGQKKMFDSLKWSPDVFENLRSFTHQLIPVERFYDSIGGIVGYQAALINLLHEKQTSVVNFRKPIGKDISEKNAFTHKAIRKSLESAKEISEFYAVGGAGDRLDLRNPKTDEPMPAALLPFLGRSILETLFRDLEAREYLLFKLDNSLVTTPVVLMTSNEKNNHQYITELFEKNDWFGRNKDNFFLFNQPLVPVVDEKGDWLFKDNFELVLKPGGHGAIWKGALMNGAFEWLEKKGIKSAIIRQINNPMAAIDHGILGFTGAGLLENKLFGFASCPRVVGSSEGMNVLREQKNETGYSYSITNVEYTEFDKQNIEDVPEEEGSLYSAYPANTNILFADLQTVKNAVKIDPIPGMLLNMKTLMEVKEGSSIKVGRLESTMQNIADSIQDHSLDPITEDEQAHLKTYLTKNIRRKTISVTKNNFEKTKKLFETREGCFHDLLYNAEDLLSNFCGFEVPNQPDEKKFLEEGPSFIFLYHPGLGPLYDIISQKIQKGKIYKKSELILEISEIFIRDLTLDGSLVVDAKSPFGKRAESRFSEKAARVRLENVSVINKGLKLDSRIGYPAGNFKREEGVKIILNGFSEFQAKNVVFKGNQVIEIPEGYKVTAFEEDAKIKFLKEKIDRPSWSYRYHFLEDNRIAIKQV